MGDLLLSRLYRAAASGETPSLLRPFVSAAFAELLRSCPGLAARLFDDITPMPEGVPEVFTDVPATNDLSIDVVVQARDGLHLLIENQLAPALEWFEERTEVRPISHVDSYIAAARHRFAGRARVLVLSRSETDVRKGHYPSELYAGSRNWPVLYERIHEFSSDASGIPAHLMQQFLDLLKEHDMNPSQPLAPHDADTIFAFDQLARNNLKLLDDAVGRIRQEFDLKATPNNRRLTGWYACSDRFQTGELHIFFYLMFPPVPDLVARAAVQVTKESSQRGLASAAENGFRRGRWGSLWVERDYRRRHPFLDLISSRQVEELVRFYQTPLARLAKAGLIKLTPARQEAPPRQAGPGSGVAESRRGAGRTKAGDREAAERGPESRLQKSPQSHLAGGPESEGGGGPLDEPSDGPSGVPLPRTEEIRRDSRTPAPKAPSVESRVEEAKVEEIGDDPRSSQPSAPGEEPKAEETGRGPRSSQPTVPDETSKAEEEPSTREKLSTDPE